MQENKKLYAIFIAVIVVCGILYVLIRRSDEQAETIIGMTPEANIPLTTQDDHLVSVDIFVQLCGAVARQGVYQVPKGTRVFEVIEKAGGLTDFAAVGVVNQAREAQDGEMIFFPTIEAVETGTYVQSEIVSLIPINTASKDELMTLPGIGEAKAASIMAYRETNNGFKSIEEIMEVDGIKDSMYNKIKALITL